MTLELPKELEASLIFYAKEQDISKEQLILNALDEYLEDLRDLELAKRAKAEFEASGKRGIEAKELYKKLGIE